jgi:spore coat protein U-like protein
MKKILVPFALALIAVAPAAFAASATLTVTAGVAANCTISGAILAFGAYDPVVANSATGIDLDAETTMSVLCTKGVTPTISTLTAGGAMASTPAGFSLNYLLFTTGARTTSFVTPFSLGASGSNKTAQTVTIYGRIAKDQDVGVAAYNGTTTVSVNF